MKTALINRLKESEQDFEYYPTTNEIIAKLIADINLVKDTHYHEYRSVDSALDIGAGHGKVLYALRETGIFKQIYAIEKSPILCEYLDNDVFIVGTDFHEQSLVAKQVGLTFCNPPYAEFEEWAVKIIRESSSRLVYLVIPERWERSVEIANAIAYRDAKAKAIGGFDFINAEDRAARAKVHLIRIEMVWGKDDAFDRFFKAEFAELKTKFDAAKGATMGERGTTRNPKMNQLVVGANYPEMLVQLYNDELDHVRKNYDLVKSLDIDLLKEFDVSPERIMECLKARLAGMRNTYWQELFSHMKSITNRLTTKKRNGMLNTLNQNGHVDFTVSNIHAVIIWALKNANTYINDQLLETFDKMVGKANVKNYSSNRRVFTYDRWRYNEEKPTHIALEYRLVLENIGGMCRGYSFESGLSPSASEFLGDLITVAHGLGFFHTAKDPAVTEAIAELTKKREQAIAADGDVSEIDKQIDILRAKLSDNRLNQSGKNLWEVGKREEFYCTVDGERELLFDVRAFLNGNVHIRLNQQFALALNVEVGRLRGWIKSGAEAAKELGDLTAARYFGRNAQLGTSSVPMLAAPAA